jgi:hypothetical protein
MTTAWPELRAEVELAAARFDALVAGLDPDRAVDGSDWAVGDTSAHVITVLDRWRRMAGGASLDVAPGRAFGPRMAEINRREIDAVAGADAADSVRDATVRWLEVAADPTAEMHPFGLDDATCTLAEAAGVLLGEILLHGRDVARSTGGSWPITRHQALAVDEGVLPLLPVLYDGAPTRGHTYEIDLRLRGRAPGRAICLRCGPTAVVVTEGHGQHPDVHISADPVTWLLLGYGRMSRTRAAAGGGLVTWGRRPWLALRLGELVRPA